MPRCLAITQSGPPCHEDASWNCGIPVRLSRGEGVTAPKDAVGGPHGVAGGPCNRGATLTCVTTTELLSDCAVGPISSAAATRGNLSVAHPLQ